MKMLGRNAGIHIYPGAVKHYNVKCATWNLNRDRRPKIPFDGAGRARRRHGSPRQDAEGWRANPRGGEIFCF